MDLRLTSKAFTTNSLLFYSFDTESTSKGEQQAEGKGETGSLLSRSLAPQAGSLMLG